MDTDLFYKTLLDNLYDGVYFVDRDRCISYWNKSAERITGYAAEEVVGKHCADNILMHVDADGHSMCTGVCPLGETICDGCRRTNDVYLHHKDGHRVPVTIRVTPIRDGDGEIVGGVEIFTDATPPDTTVGRLAELERMAYVDPLTGLANRRYAEITLNSRIEELQRYGWRFGLLFIDIDHFKAVNDRHGHAQGDEVLKTVARTLKNSIRSFDIAGRWGGEEFLVVLANVDAGELIATANRCRLLVEQSTVPALDSLRVTVSIGAALAHEADTLPSLVERADRLMYESKQAGRNRVTVEA